MPPSLRAAAAGMAIAVAAALLAPAPPVSAQDGSGSITWGIVPATADGPDGRPAFDYKLDPGAELVDHVAVSNHSTEEITLAVYASDAFTTASGGFDLLPGAEPPVDVGSWITLDSPELTIPPRSRVHVPFQLTVPVDATPGDHAGGLVASLVAGQPGGQVAVEHRVGARIYLRVAGELRPQLTVEQIDAAYEGTWNPFAGGAVTATYTVRNTGNVRLAAASAIELVGPFGLGRRKVGGDPPVQILPGDAVTATVRGAGVAPLFRLTAAAAIYPSGVDGDQLGPLPSVAGARTTVWAVPWSQGILLLLVCAGIAAWWWRRRRRRRQVAAQLAAAREQGRAEALRAATRAGDET